MRAAITTRKGFCTGVIYIVVGIGALLMARHYTLGSAARMGPGYFPIAVAALLVAVGVAIVVRSFLRDDTAISRVALKPMLLVLGSITAFGFLINRAGLIVAALVLVVGCAAASDRFRLGVMPLLGLVALIAFCAGLFVLGMGIPMPLVGPWFSGIGE